MAPVVLAGTHFSYAKVLGHSSSNNLDDYLEEILLVVIIGLGLRPRLWEI